MTARSSQRAQALALAACVIGVVTAASCWVDRKSSEFECVSDADCASLGGNRVCDLSAHYCVIGTGTGSDGCPPECNAGCDVLTRQCSINGGSNVACPAGYACQISCGSNACDAVDCSAATACTIQCAGPNSCDAVVCGPTTTSCDISCLGSNTCSDLRCSSGRCQIMCVGSNACDAVDCTGSCACDVACSGGCTPTCSDPTCAAPTGCSSALAGCDTCP